MKKTTKTMMTAAMFAAALGASSAGAVSANDDIQPSSNSFDPASMTDEFAPVYGPPADTTTEPKETTTDNVEVLYGPPYIFLNDGDLNGDDVINTADVAMLRRWILRGFPYPEEEYTMLADFNGDGIADGQDLQILQEYILRKRDNLDENNPPLVYGPPIYSEDTTTSTTITTTVPLTTSETALDTTPQTVYGPPITTTD